MISAYKPIEFKALPYSYNALAPIINRLNVQVHYGTHHRAYFDNFIYAIKGTSMESKDMLDIFKNISKYPVTVRNNGGGYFNHTFYWEGMHSPGGNAPVGNLSEAIIQTFGSHEAFKKEFSDAGKARFGSGWAWLCLDERGNLFVCSTPNHDNPLMDSVDKRGIPLLTIDVWEHAYYMKYQNKRDDYADSFWTIVNWEEIARRYEIGLKSINLN